MKILRDKKPTRVRRYVIKQAINYKKGICNATEV